MCLDCDWEEELGYIGKLMGNGKYDYALATLEKIANWVEENEHISPAQIQAIKNIERGGRKNDYQDGYSA